MSGVWGTELHSPCWETLFSLDVEADADEDDAPGTQDAPSPGGYVMSVGELVQEIASGGGDGGTMIARRVLPRNADKECG